MQSNKVIFPPFNAPSSSLSRAFTFIYLNKRYLIKCSKLQGEACAASSPSRMKSLRAEYHETADL